MSANSAWRPKTAGVASGENEEDGGKRRQLPIDEQRYEITGKQGGNGRARISEPVVAVMRLSSCMAYMTLSAACEKQRKGARDCLGAHKNKVKPDNAGSKMHAGVNVPALIGRCRNQHKHPYLPYHMRQTGTSAAPRIIIRPGSTAQASLSSCVS